MIATLSGVRVIVQLVAGVNGPGVTDPTLGLIEQKTSGDTDVVQLEPFASLHPTVALNVSCCVSSSVAAVGNSATVTAAGLMMIVPLVANELMGLLVLVTVSVTGSPEGMSGGVTVP